MKVSVSLFIALFFSLMCMAQGPDIEGTWYLHSYEYDPANVNEIKDISPPISPTIVFDENYAFTGVVCNAYGGDFTYNEVDDNFTLNFFDFCLCGSCNNPAQSHIDLESDYSNFFILGTFSYFLFVNQTTGENVLQLEPSEGFVLTYKDVPVSLGSTDIRLDHMVLSPNPAKDYLHISPTGLLIDTATIYSFTGKKIQHYKSVVAPIAVSNFPKGMYFITLVSGQEKTTQKFIKN